MNNLPSGSRQPPHIATINGSGINLSLNTKNLLSKPTESSNIDNTSSFKVSSNNNNNNNAHSKNAKNLITLPIQQQQHHLKPKPKRLDLNNTNSSAPTTDNEITSSSKPNHYATSLPINNYPNININQNTITTTTNPNKIYSRKEVITTYKEETKNTHSEEYLQTTTFYDTLDGTGSGGSTKIGKQNTKPIITAPKPLPQVPLPPPPPPPPPQPPVTSSSSSINPIYSSMPLKISTKLITTTTTQQNTTLLDVIDNLDYSVSSSSGAAAAVTTTLTDKNSNSDKNNEEDDEGKMHKKIILNSNNKCSSSNSSSSFNKNCNSSNLNGILSSKIHHENNINNNKNKTSSYSYNDPRIMHFHHHLHHHYNPNELKLIVKTAATTTIRHSPHSQTKITNSSSSKKNKKKRQEKRLSQINKKISSSASSLNTNSTCENHSVYDNVIKNSKASKNFLCKEEEALSFSLSSSVSTSSLSFLNELLTTNTSMSASNSEQSLSKFSFLSASSSSSNRTVKSSDSSLSLSSALSPSPIVELMTQKKKKRVNFNTKERLLGGISFKSKTLNQRDNFNNKHNKNNHSTKISSIELNKKDNKIEKKIVQCNNQTFGQAAKRYTKKRQQQIQRSSKSLPPKSNVAKIMTSFGETTDLKFNKREEILNTIKLIDDEEDNLNETLINEPICFTSTSFNEVRKIVNKFDLNAQTRTITSGTTPIRHYPTNNANTTPTTTKLVKTIITSPKLMYERNESDLMEKIMCLSNDATPLTTPTLEKASDLLSTRTPLQSKQTSNVTTSGSSFEQNKNEEKEVADLNLINLVNFSRVGSQLASLYRPKCLNVPINDELKMILDELIEKVAIQSNEEWHEKI